MDENAGNSMNNSPEPVIPQPASTNGQKPYAAPPPVENDEPAEPEIVDNKGVRATWLIPYRFKPGQSGNPNGRPKRQPYTDALLWAVDLPCPLKQRRQLQKILGVKLPPSFTLAQAMAVGNCVRGITDPRTAESIATRTDGPIRMSLQLSGAGGGPLLAPNVTLQFIEMAKDGTPVRVIDVTANKPVESTPHDSSAGCTNTDTGQV